VVFTVKDRTTAGRMLANALGHYRNHSNLLILAIPRGGVPLAWEIAQALHAPLDIICVRKLGCPQQPELAFSVLISRGGIKTLNQDIISEYNISDMAIEDVIEREQKELLRREQLYSGDKTAITIKDRPIIIVDDGLATGATMKVAIEVVKEQQASSIVVAVAVAPMEVISEIRDMVNQAVYLDSPRPFYSVGEYYQEFDQLSDPLVCQILARQ